MSSASLVLSERGNCLTWVAAETCHHDKVAPVPWDDSASRSNLNRFVFCFRQIVALEVPAMCRASAAFKQVSSATNVSARLK
jgi:hypothetical protein